MLKKIGVSMSVETNKRRRGNRIDVIDQRLIALLASVGYHAVPVPNLCTGMWEWLSAVAPEGFVLSGGNDLGVVGGDAPERDAAEDGILAWATERTLPVVGICRGMQMLATRHGVRLERRPNHDGVEHYIHGVLSGRISSYHNWCVPTAPHDFRVLAYADDGSVEAIASSNHRVLGIMWHPERMDGVRPLGTESIMRTLGGTDCGLDGSIPLNDDARDLTGNVRFLSVDRQ